MPETMRVVADGPVVLATGFFDGVHLGHRAVLDAAVRSARRRGAAAWALTFRDHPRAVFDPAGVPALLTSFEQRLDLLRAAGLDGVYPMPFDAATAALPPAAFAELLHKAFPGLEEVHCGANWRFGANAAGTPGLLGRLGARFGFAVAVAPAVLCKGSPVSSTRIRAAVASGDLPAAGAMLGRPFAIRGVVGHGRRVGSENGIATANITPRGTILPPTGVYAVSSSLGGAERAGVADLGWRPTFADARPESPVLEVHYIDFSGDLYGKTIDVAFRRRLRDERTFPSPEALFAQIRSDIAAARKAIGKL